MAHTQKANIKIKTLQTYRKKIKNQPKGAILASIYKAGVWSPSWFRRSGPPPHTHNNMMFGGCTKQTNTRTSDRHMIHGKIVHSRLETAVLLSPLLYLPTVTDNTKKVQLLKGMMMRSFTMRKIIIQQTKWTSETETSQKTD